MLGAGSDARELGMNDFTANRDLLYERSGNYFADRKKYIIESFISRRIPRLGTTGH